MSKKKYKLRESMDQVLINIQEILQEWDIQPRKFKKTDLGYKIKTFSGYKILRESLSEERVIFMHHVLEHLAGKGCRGFPRLIPTKYGDVFVNHGLHIYYLTDWYGGEEFKEKNEEHIFSAARAMGDFHQAARNFFHPAGYDSRERWEELPRRLREQILYIENCLPVLPPEFDRAWSILGTKAKNSIEQLNNAGFIKLVEKAKEERTVCHRHFTPRNLAIEEFAVPVRWEHCALGVQITDLIGFMHRVMPRYHWKFSVAEGILEAYKTAASLSLTELHSLGAALTFPFGFVKLVQKAECGDADKEKALKQLAKIMSQEEEKTIFLKDYFHRFRIEREKLRPPVGEYVSRMWYCMPGETTIHTKIKRKMSAILPLTYSVSPKGNIQGNVDEKVKQAAAQMGIPLIPVVYSTGWPVEEAVISSVLADKGKMSRLIEDICDMLCFKDYPGVNINFQIYNLEEAADLNTFVERLSEKLRSAGKFLLVNAAAPKGQQLHYDYRFLGRFADFVLIEILDENLRFPGPVASKDFVINTLNYVSTFISPGKIVAVLPVYGYRWWRDKNIREALSYENALQLAGISGLQRDQATGCLRAVINNSREFEIWAEDLVSLKEKISSAGKIPIGGMAFWRLGLEDPAIWEDESES